MSQEMSTLKGLNKLVSTKSKQIFLVKLNSVFLQQRYIFLAKRYGFVVLFLILHILNESVFGTIAVGKSAIAFLPTWKSVE